MRDRDNNKHSRNEDGFSLKLLRPGNSRISYNEKTLRKIFSTEIENQVFFEASKHQFEELGLPWEDKLFLRFDEDNTPIYTDKVNTYRMNSIGYRSAEFDGTAEVVFAGCSNTFGTGIPEEVIWGSALANQLGKSYANISKQGASVQWIVRNILSYFDEHGHPETLCCLFPDFYRMTLATNSGQLVYGGNGHRDSRYPDSDDFTRILEIHLDQALPPSMTPTYSKKPHEAADVLPADIAVFESMQSILFLEQYCRSHGIKFAWSTWDTSILSFLLEVKELFPKNYTNLVDIDVDCWVQNPDREIAGEVFLGLQFRNSPNKEHPVVECHQELMSTYGVNFYRGLDDINGIDYAHMGAHQHRHIAETFIEFLDKN
jgi:hypothetical protein